MGRGKAGAKKRRKKKKGRPKADEETGSLTADSEPADAGYVDELSGATEHPQAPLAGRNPAAADGTAEVHAKTGGEPDHAEAVTEEQHAKPGKAKAQAAAAEKARQQHQRPSENGHHRLPEAATGRAFFYISCWLCAAKV